MTWRPNSGPDIARARATMLGRARTFFNERDVLEINTPALSECTAIDPNTESITALHSGRRSFLHTSPEHFMKRLLAAGYPDIYQICRVFRDGETGRCHLPEFTMVEWYRLDFGLQAIMLETADFASRLLARKKLRSAPVLVSYSQAFQSALSLDPLLADSDSLADAVAADSRLRSAIGNDRDAWLDLAMASRVATEFDGDQLTLVHHYPASQAALARNCPDDRRLSDRFELYYGALELANGFVELTDAKEQEARFRNDQEARQSRGQPVHAVDENLIDALRSGLPPSAGVAVGLDRLLMIDEGLDDIRAVSTFTPGT